MARKNTKEEPAAPKAKQVSHVLIMIFDQMERTTITESIHPDGIIVHIDAPTVQEAAEALLEYAYTMEDESETDT